MGEKSLSKWKISPSTFLLSIPSYPIVGFSVSIEKVSNQLDIKNATLVSWLAWILSKPYSDVSFGTRLYDETFHFLLKSNIMIFVRKIAGRHVRWLAM